MALATKDSESERIKTMYVGRDFKKAQAQAIANANSSDKTWMVFSDTSGNLRVEPYSPTFTGNIISTHEPAKQEKATEVQMHTEDGPKCQIQWVDDKTGQPTPDTNPAIGRCQLGAHDDVLHECGRTHIPASPWYYICTDHAKRLHDPGMQAWIFEPLPSDERREYQQNEKCQR